MALKIKDVELIEVRAQQLTPPEESKAGKVSFEAGAEAIVDPATDNRLTILFTSTFSGSDRVDAKQTFEIFCKYRQVIESSEAIPVDDPKVQDTILLISMSLHTLAYSRSAEIATVMGFPVRTNVSHTLSGKVTPPEKQNEQQKTTKQNKSTARVRKKKSQS